MIPVNLASVKQNQMTKQHLMILHNGFGPAHVNWIMKTIPTIPHSPCLSFKSDYFYYGLGYTQISLDKGKPT